MPMDAYGSDELKFTKLDHYNVDMSSRIKFQNPLNRVTCFIIASKEKTLGQDIVLFW